MIHTHGARANLFGYFLKKRNKGHMGDNCS